MHSMAPEARRRRILVGMSGGVDSSVAALRLLKEGNEVVGATMLVWAPPGVDMGHTDSCCGLSAAEDARRVCSRLGIPHYTLDFREEFFQRVVREYVDEYLHGRTPNPCVRCNERIKFDALLRKADALGMEAVATGHYARIETDAVTGERQLLRGIDRQKDQSYALYRLRQEQLERILFPLGGLEKPEVRSQAEEAGLPTAGKPDSQETCFVPNNDYPALLRHLAPEALTPGEFRDRRGERLGTHQGVASYTIGQRRRINVGSPEPLYVSRIDPAHGVITLVPRDDPSLLTSDVWARDVRFVSPSDEVRLRCEGASMAVGARVRYNSADRSGRLTVVPVDGETWLRVLFDGPVRAVSPGQSLVCYEGERVIGGGFIAPGPASERDPGLEREASG